MPSCDCSSSQKHLPSHFVICVSCLWARNLSADTLMIYVCTLYIVLCPKFIKAILLIYSNGFCWGASCRSLMDIICHSPAANGYASEAGLHF